MSDKDIKMTSPSAEVTIRMGEDGQNYPVSREVLIKESQFFSTFCTKPAFKEELALELPELEPETFNVVLKWLQEHSYTLPENLDIDDFTKFYKSIAAMNLQSLKAEILEQLGDKIVAEHETNADGMDRDSLYISDPLDLFYGITYGSKVADRLLLRKLVDKILPIWGHVGEQILGLALSTSPDSDNLANAVVIDSFQEMLWTNICIDCRKTLHPEPKTECRLCNKKLPYERREGWP
ncbi:hypothetical protein H072_523 [Dactylellina haptotyla CBS 200.50]|uniref:BTB domain-containing protein n=1 Tax=Dactylellina haptotyla (strain CBS 200.50) TaxID=1284197 RepID=S8C189_DACHA|nr:hypothetical protein H072_523 [Dactylellina haptotyla CBS 200.50]